MRNNQKNKLPRPPKSGLGFFIVFLSFFPAFLRRGEKNIEKTHPFCKKGGDKRTKCGKIKARTRSDARRAKNLPTACGVHYDYFIPRRRNGHSAKKGGGKETRQSPRRVCKNNTEKHKRKKVTACAKQFRSVSVPKCFRVSRGFSPFPRKRAARKNCFSGGFFAPQKKSNFF